jgi:hypothetical protein
MNDIDRRRLNTAKEVFIRLASGGKFSRKQLFTDPTSNQHFNEDYWEFRFIDYLIEVGIVGTAGNRQAKRYWLLSDVSGEPRDILQVLLSDDAKVLELIKTGTLQLNPVTEPEVVSSVAVVPETEVNPLEVIADRLLENIQLLAAIHAQNEKLEERVSGLEKVLKEITPQLESIKQLTRTASDRVGRAVKLKLLAGGTNGN